MSVMIGKEFEPEEHWKKLKLIHQPIWVPNSIYLPMKMINQHKNDLLGSDSSSYTFRAFHTSRNWFRGLVGYGICLTRRTSPVRSWAKSVFFSNLTKETKRQHGP